MAVRNNRSELAVTNRHQGRLNFTSEKSSFEAFDWTNDIFSLVKILLFSVFIGWHFFTQKFNTYSQASVNMNLFNSLKREI